MKLLTFFAIVLAISSFAAEIDNFSFIKERAAISAVFFNFIDEADYREEPDANERLAKTELALGISKAMHRCEALFLTFEYRTKTGKNVNELKKDVYLCHDQVTQVLMVIDEYGNKYLKAKEGLLVLLSSLTKIKLGLE